MIRWFAIRFAVYIGVAVGSGLLFLALAFVYSLIK